MGLGKISDPGISVLNKTKLKEEGEEKKNLGEIKGQPQIWGHLLNACNPTLSVRPFHLEKHTDFNDVYTIV